MNLESISIAYLFLNQSLYILNSHNSDYMPKDSQKLISFITQIHFLFRIWIQLKQWPFHKLVFVNEILHNNYLLTHLYQLVNWIYFFVDLWSLDLLIQIFGQSQKWLTSLDVWFEYHWGQANSNHLLKDLLILGVVELSCAV